jgi:GNAT superfamily N-acetyltransferase
MDIRLLDNGSMMMILPLLEILNPGLPKAVIIERLNEMLGRGYQCAGAWDGEELVAICGIWILTKVYVGRHIELDNVAVRPDCRVQGVGRQLVDWVLAYGRELGCVTAELNCYIANEAGQKFWEKTDFKAIGYHYQIRLS